MKISKKCSTESATNTANIAAVPVVESECENCKEADRSEAIQHIKAAIDCLGKGAKEDITAKTAIANLSVVLFELK